MRKGFTLIELLAVIVILAIIALIATPIILGIINDAREKANERSVELYASAVRNAIAAYQLTGTSAPKSFDDLNVQYDGEVECSTSILYEDGSFYLDGCKVNDGAKEYSYGTKQPICKLNDKDGDKKASLSDIVTCETESFYIMSNENNEITMLSMYNLDVGNSMDTVSFIPIPIENPTGIQNELAKGYSNDDTSVYGVVPFASENYWTIEGGVDLLPEFENRYIYGDYKDSEGNPQNLIYKYVNAYEIYLNQQGIISASATLMSDEQAEKLGCNDSCSDAPEWVYSTSYWLGSSGKGTEELPELTTQVLTIQRGNGGYGVWPYSDGPDIHGVRPVIKISTSEIQ